MTADAVDPSRLRAADATDPPDTAVGPDGPGSAGEPAGKQRSDAYLKQLFWLLIAATFFEGYDSSILALVLPDIQDTFGVTESELGVSRGFIELGLFFAFFVARLGDRIGRRALLLWSVVGYTVFTALSAVSWDLWSFTFFQSASRVFLGAEYAVAVTMIVEEFPVHRRAGALGRLLMMAAAGALAVALLLIVGIDQGPLEWRTLYLVGLLPLLVLGWFRRRVKETRRFEEYREAVEAGVRIRRVSFWEPWKPEYRGNLLLAGMAHFARSMPLFASTAWFFYYGQREAGVERQLLFVMFIVAYGIGILGYAFCGFLMERAGRRTTAVVYGLGSIVFPILLFQSRQPAAMGVLLVLGVFFGLGQAPLFGAMSTELFPTHVRNQAAAWARNVFEIAGFILGPLLVGVLGDHYSGALGSVGDTVSLLFLFGIPGLWLVWRYLPETRGKELEEIEAEVTGLGIDTLAPLDGAAPGPAETAAPADDAEARRLPAPEARRRALLGTAIGLVVVGLVVAALQVAGEVVRRPEGAAERFLQAVSEGDSERIDQYGTDDVARLLATFEPDDPDDDLFDAVEVGRGRDTGSDTVSVPFRVVAEDGTDTESFGFLQVQEQPSGDTPRPWEVVDLVIDPSAADEVPSGGGAEPTTVGAATWIGGVAAAVGLVLLVERLLARAGGVHRQGRRATTRAPDRPRRSTPGRHRNGD